MTVGKDVSALFPDVVNCMQTDNLELKKLVYLYLMNYAKSQPDMAIMAVNTFVKVSPRVSLFSTHLATTIRHYLLSDSREHIHYNYYKPGLDERYIVEECGFLFVRYQMASGHFDRIPTIPILFVHWMSVDHLIGN